MANVKLDRVTKAFGHTVAVTDFSVEIADGELVSFLGPSGCGKTTTLRAVAGFEQITSGEIWIGDTLVAAPAKRTLVPPERRAAGMVFQSYAVWPHMTVFDNVGYPLSIKGVDRARRRTAVQAALALVQLGTYAERYPHQLSGGQQQRVALARALIMEPQVLLLDEPLANLDANLREQMRFEIKELQRRVGLTIIYVTHDQAEAMALSDRIVVMDQGRIEQIGTPADIYERPASRFVAGFVGITNFLPATALSRADDIATVTLANADAQPIAAPLADPTATGDRWTLSVRPESISLVTPDAGHVNGRILRRVYLGATVDYLIAVGDQEVRAITDAASPRHEGDAVGLRLGSGRLYAG